MSLDIRLKVKQFMEAGARADVKPEEREIHFVHDKGYIVVDYTFKTINYGNADDGVESFMSSPAAWQDCLAVIDSYQADDTEAEDMDFAEDEASEEELSLELTRKVFTEKFSPAIANEIAHLRLQNPYQDEYTKFMYKDPTRGIVVGLDPKIWQNDFAVNVMIGLGIFEQSRRTSWAKVDFLGWLYQANSEEFMGWCDVFSLGDRWGTELANLSIEWRREDRRWPLSVSHYADAKRVEDIVERHRLMDMAEQQNWSVSQLREARGITKGGGGSATPAPLQPHDDGYIVRGTKAAIMKAISEELDTRMGDDLCLVFKTVDPSELSIEGS